MLYGGPESSVHCNLKHMQTDKMEEKKTTALLTRQHMKQRQQSVSSSNRVKNRKYILVYVPKISFSVSSFCVVCLTHWM